MLKKWVVWGAIVAGVLLALGVVLLGLAWSLSGYAGSSGRAAQEYADWQANGLPITQDQLFPTPAPAESDNAAPLLRETFRVFKANGGSLIKSYQEGTKEKWANGSVAALVEKHRVSLDQVTLAVAKPQCRFIRDWDEGFVLMIPEFALASPLCQLLTWDARLKAQRGGWQGAVERLRAARRLAHHMSSDPVLFGASNAVKFDSFAVKESARLAATFADNREALAGVRAMLQQTEWRVDRTLPFRGEAYLMLASYRGLSDRDGQTLLRGGWDDLPDKPPIVRQGMPSKRLIRPVAAEWMAFWNKFYPRIADPREDLKKVAADMDAEEGGPCLPKVLALLSRSYSKSYVVAFDAQVSDTRTVIAYTGILEYRAAHHGAWPKTLKDAGVDAIDELDGKPLRYMSSGDTASVWNVGRDLIDGGGVRGLSFRTGDTVFSFPWPPS
jgi:hypothetical protein